MDFFGLQILNSVEVVKPFCGVITLHWAKAYFNGEKYFSNIFLLAF